MANYAEFLIAMNVVFCASVIVLGYLQKRYMDAFSVLTGIILCADGLCAVCVYGRTELFPAAAAGVGILLLVHNAMVHFPMECAGRMTCPAFRPRHVCNHETWVLVATTAGLVSALRM